MTGRVIFLDIDGVLNSFDKFDYLTTFRAPGMLDRLRVDLNRVEAFNHILLHTPFIQVVVSSTWRYNTFDKERSFLKFRDFCKVTRLNPRIFHKDWHTPLIGDGENRLAEVEAWLERHPEVFKALVLDDGYEAQFKTSKNIKYIRTDPRTGISHANLKKAMNFFGVRVRDDLTLATAGGPMIVA